MWSVGAQTRVSAISAPLPEAGRAPHVAPTPADAGASAGVDAQDCRALAYELVRVWSTDVDPRWGSDAHVNSALDASMRAAPVPRTAGAPAASSEDPRAWALRAVNHIRTSSMAALNAWFSESFRMVQRHIHTESAPPPPQVSPPQSELPRPSVPDSAVAASRDHAVAVAAQRGRADEVLARLFGNTPRHGGEEEEEEEEDDEASSVFVNARGTRDSHRVHPSDAMDATALVRAIQTGVCACDRSDEHVCASTRSLHASADPTDARVSVDGDLMARLIRRLFYTNPVLSQRVLQNQDAVLSGPTTALSHSAIASAPEAARGTHVREHVDITAAHVSNFLVTPGLVPNPRGAGAPPIDMPPCAHGTRCVGNDHAVIPGHPNSAVMGPLCAFMLPAEWDEVVRTGDVPAHVRKRVCILCSRWLVTSVVVGMGAQDRALEESIPITYLKYVMGPGNYNPKACIQPRADPFNGLLYPTVPYAMPLYAVVYDRDLSNFRRSPGVRRMREDAVRWPSTVTRPPGMAITAMPNFGNGAASTSSSSPPAPLPPPS